MEIITREQEKKNELTGKIKKKKMKEAHLSQLEAESYLAKSKRTYRMIGLGVWLILVGVSATILLGGTGVAVMFLCIAIAVMMFIFSASQMGIYEEIEGVPIRLDEQTYQLIDAQRAHVYPHRLMKIALGVGLILAAVGGVAGLSLSPAFLISTVGLSVFLFITSAASMGTYDHLLSRGDYAKNHPSNFLETSSHTIEDHSLTTAQIPVHIPATSVISEEPIQTNNHDVDGIKQMGFGFISELYSAKAFIDNPATLADIDEICDLTNKIVYRLQKEPELIPSTMRLFDYYLPTTVKLVVTYSEVKKQGISGDNIAGTLSKIEEALSNLTSAYKSQLEKLYLHTSVDLEADIATLEAMLTKEGLLPDGVNDIIDFSKT